MCFVARPIRHLVRILAVLWKESVCIIRGVPYHKESRRLSMVGKGLKCAHIKCKNGACARNFVHSALSVTVPTKETAHKRPKFY